MDIYSFVSSKQRKIYSRTLITRKSLEIQGSNAIFLPLVGGIVFYICWEKQKRDWANFIPKGPFNFEDFTEEKIIKDFLLFRNG